MDTEEKARAYDEALKWMRELYPELHGATKEDAEHYFPELRESEDERIRKELLKEIEFITPRNGETDSEGLILPSYHARIDRYKSYLEKQKEQKPESCDCSRDEESYTNGIHHVLMNPEAYGLIKQKPTEQLGGIFTSYDMAKTFTEGQNYVIAHPEKFGLCKPAEWSEEDKKDVAHIIRILDDCYAYGRHDLSKTDHENLVNKLKSLHPQPHEEIYQSAKRDLAIKFMNYLDENRPDGKMCLSNAESEDIDKAFKENDLAKIVRYYEKYRPHWKPSEEQMKMLAMFSSLRCASRQEAATLESLYNDLKRLM